MRLWTAIVTELWAQLFLDQRGVWPVPKSVRDADRTAWALWCQSQERVGQNNKLYSRPPRCLSCANMTGWIVRRCRWWPARCAVLSGWRTRISNGVHSSSTDICSKPRADDYQLTPGTEYSANPMSKKGPIYKVLFAGIDGAGKTTCLDSLISKLSSKYRIVKIASNIPPYLFF